MFVKTRAKRQSITPIYSAALVALDSRIPGHPSTPCGIVNLLPVSPTTPVMAPTPPDPQSVREDLVDELLAVRCQLGERAAFDELTRCCC
jgi:hypothetical protein